MTEDTFQLYINIIKHPIPGIKLPLSVFKHFQTCYDPEGYNIAFKNYINDADTIDPSLSKAKKITLVKTKVNNFKSELETVKANIRTAPTILKILQTHSEFKKENNDLPDKFKNLKSSIDLLQYCRDNKIKFEDIYNTVINGLTEKVSGKE